MLIMLLQKTCERHPRTEKEALLARDYMLAITEAPNGNMRHGLRRTQGITNFVLPYNLEKDESVFPS